MRETSLIAYDIVYSKISPRRKQVLECLENGEMTNAMISKKLSLPINCITGRTNELVKMGLVVESYKDKCPITNNLAIFWRINLR
jgi:predicted transcriptional regulator